jgi:hypothetical protein
MENVTSIKNDSFVVNFTPASASVTLVIKKKTKLRFEKRNPNKIISSNL